MEVKSYRGITVDMNRLRLQNEDKVALGNMGVNARGDKLGKGGKVVQTREEIIREHYQKNPQPVQQASIYEDPMEVREEQLRKEAEEFAAVSEPVVEPVVEKPKKKKTAKKISEPIPNDDAAVAKAAEEDEKIDFK